MGMKLCKNDINITITDLLQLNSRSKSVIVNNIVLDIK